LGFIIDNEIFVEEHQKKYVIIKFVKGSKKYSKIDIQYGPFLKENLLYLAYELQKKLEIKEKISGNSFLAKKQNDYEILKLKKLIKKIEEQ
jgi:tRNA A22 N-methylase